MKSISGMFYFLCKCINSKIFYSRAMEFLSNKLELSRTLRVPAISRLQKIHNVEVVFKTLEEQGIKTGT